MGQWRGQYRSDFFQFTADSFRAYHDERMAPLKSATNVVKTIGPQGAGKSLSYDFTDESGRVQHATATAAQQCIRLEAYFRRHGIPVAVITWQPTAAPAHRGNT